MNRILTTGAAITIFTVTACSSGPARPRFYPNDYYRQVGSAQADSDAAQCMALGEQYAENPSAWQGVAKTGLGGAAVGAGVGAIGGVITKGQVGRTTAAGAAIGGLVGIASELYKGGETNPSYERFVEHCLQKKGYEVISWGR